jgi:hypothetical protein
MGVAITLIASALVLAFAIYLAVLLSRIRREDFGEGFEVEIPDAGIRFRCPGWWKIEPRAGDAAAASGEGAVRIRTGNHRGLLTIERCDPPPAAEAAPSAGDREGLKARLAAVLAHRGYTLDEPEIGLEASGTEPPPVREAPSGASAPSPANAASGAGNRPRGGNRPGAGATTGANDRSGVIAASGVGARTRANATSEAGLRPGAGATTGANNRSGVIARTGAGYTSGTREPSAAPPLAGSGAPPGSSAPSASRHLAGAGPAPRETIPRAWVASNGRTGPQEEGRSYIELHLVEIAGIQALFTYTNSVLYGYLDAFYLERLMKTVKGRGVTGAPVKPAGPQPSITVRRRG